VIDPALAFEIVAAVFVHPAEKRHQYALFDEQNEGGCTGAAVRSIPHLGREAPGVWLAEQLRKYQASVLGRADGGTHYSLDVGENRRIRERFASGLDELPAQPLAHTAMQVSHDRVDIDACGVTCQSLRLLPIAR
jgi:hypothetical protein